VPTPVAAAKPKPALTPDTAPTVNENIPVTQESSEQGEDESAETSEASRGGSVMGLAGASASGSEDNPLQRYLGLIESRIQRLKEYPPQARLRGQEGTVEVSFRVNEQGRIEDFRITRSAGSTLLDRAVERLFARLRLPPPEPDLLPELRSLTLPVVFELNSP
jgi:periplasmic protein TonB